MKKHKFALVLDDVWETTATSLIEELCAPHSPHHNSNIIIASSRTISVLSQLGAPTLAVIQMQDWSEDHSWRLFLSHAFLHSEGVFPMSIDQEIAWCVYNECGDLPLALKVVGQAMADITQSNKWELAVDRLQSDATNSLYGNLRLSYDTLADVAGCCISLLLCFLCLAAYPENNIISPTYAIAYWTGEGLVTGPNPFQIGEMVHNVLRDLAHQIAANEEKCFFQAGRGLRQFPADVSSGYVRISLIDNSLSSVPKKFRASYIRSFLLASNTFSAEISEEVIGSMTSLRVLDLSPTALQLLQKNMGYLKHLVCLRLCYVPIKRLPNTVASLKGLQILDLEGYDISQLPVGISKLTSLKALDIGFCEHLQCVPYGSAHLTFLEYLNTSNSPNIRLNKCRGNRLSISHFGTLNQLKRLGFQYNGKIIPEGMLGTMKQMEYLHFHLTDENSTP
ncbi:probable disease resistance protein At4g27220 [Cryptomeria japonica]|uniref:probable disease resistance protein At4g27220 n=1 Tax=Cryptomeria japonica TaxID=3369 RepID=UPI0027DA278D|nr:probable disease resistance protein At4g27220 [Cryptomeria japonica]